MLEGKTTHNQLALPLEEYMMHTGTDYYI